MPSSNSARACGCNWGETVYISASSPLACCETRNGSKTCVCVCVILLTIGLRPGSSVSQKMGTLQRPQVPHLHHLSSPHICVHTTWMTSPYSSTAPHTWPTYHPTFEFTVFIPEQYSGVEILGYLPLEESHLNSVTSDQLPNNTYVLSLSLSFLINDGVNSA